MKVKNLVLTILIAIFMFIPLGVFADGETDNKVIINFFHGDGCPHCANAQDFFTSIAKEHGSKYELVKYEVWNNEKNQKLMMAVGDYLEADVSGVPFIVIGDKVFNGYAESYDEQIIAKINEEYAKSEDERINVTEKVDVVGEPEEGTAVKEEEDGTFASIVFLVIILGFAGLIVFARQKNTTSKVKEAKQPKIVKIEPTKEDKKEEVENKKENENKKTSKNKKK